MARPLCLALPSSPLSQSSARSLHWLIDAGDEIEPGRVIACLLGEHEVDVLVPDGVCGKLKSRLIDEGAWVVPGDPLLTFVPDKGGQSGRGPLHPLGHLAEEASTFVPPHSRSVVIVEVTDMNRIRPLAIVGLILLLGVSTAVVTTIVYLVSGGLAPLLIGALALSIVALALVYGEQHLGKANAIPI
jgi:hypothetical protein